MQYSVYNDWTIINHLSLGTQGLAVTYCCYGEEENKLMAIAQKCCLNLCPLPGESRLHIGDG